MDLTKFRRRPTCCVRIGDVTIGGNHPIAVQSMTNTDTNDTEACVAQIERIDRAGGKIVRLTAQGRREAENLRRIVARLREEGYRTATVADIHFVPEVASIAARYVEKVRINPGNYRTDHGELEALIDQCRERGVALRIGVNHGSLAKRVFDQWGDTPQGMVVSAMEFLRVCRAKAFDQVVVSMKSSNTRVMVAAYRLLVEAMEAEGMNYPIHLGVTEAGNGLEGRIKSAVGIGALLADGIGDTIRVSLTEAPEHEIENAKLMAKAGDDPKKLRKIKKKKAPEGFVTWNKQTFERLIETQPETLKPRLRITHSMVISVVEQGGDARARVHDLIETSLQTPEEKAKLEVRADEIFATLIDSGVVVRTEVPPAPDAPADAAPDVDYALTVDLPEDFALDQPLSPFLLAALELLDPESETYTMDLISMVEATLEDPKQVLRAQERAARDRAMAEMKADGVDYEERLERIQDVTYEKPLEDLLDAAFDKYCQEVPWANDYQLSPKSVLRDMLESASDFKGYIQKLGIARSEGILLRYLAEAYRSLDRTVPIEKRDERLRDIISWLGFVVRSVDSSLVDEWENAGNPAALDAAPPQGIDEVVANVYLSTETRSLRTVAAARCWCATHSSAA